MQKANARGLLGLGLAIVAAAVVILVCPTSTAKTRGDAGISTALISHASADPVARREIALRMLCRLLKKGMTREEVVGVFGEPVFVDAESNTFYYSPHPDRLDHLIGDRFQILELGFTPDGKLIDWVWITPARN